MRASIFILIILYHGVWLWNCHCTHVLILYEMYLIHLELTPPPEFQTKIFNIIAAILNSSEIQLSKTMFCTMLYYFQTFFLNKFCCIWLISFALRRLGCVMFPPKLHVTVPIMWVIVIKRSIFTSIMFFVRSVPLQNYVFVSVLYSNLNTDKNVQYFRDFRGKKLRLLVNEFNVNALCICVSLNGFWCT